MDIFSKLSRLSRARKLELFSKTMRPTKESKTLDVGAEVDPDGEPGLQLIDSYLWKEKLSAVNISPESISRIKQYYPEVEAVVGDACDLPWPDKHFDIVYSNAVIEHVGDLKKQERMAAEIMRVGKRWFVSTPNRWYPFEIHIRLPFITWLPGDGYLWASKIVRYSPVKGKYLFGKKRSGLRLISPKELRGCFPNSKIIKNRVTFMAETLIVVGGEV